MPQSGGLAQKMTSRTGRWERCWELPPSSNLQLQRLESAGLMQVRILALLIVVGVWNEYTFFYNNVMYPIEQLWRSFGPDTGNN
jgi:hypothetical protein